MQCHYHLVAIGRRRIAGLEQLQRTAVEVACLCPEAPLEVFAAVLVEQHILAQLLPFFFVQLQQLLQIRCLLLAAIMSNVWNRSLAVNMCPCINSTISKYCRNLTGFQSSLCTYCSCCKSAVCPSLPSCSTCGAAVRLLTRAPTCAIQSGLHENHCRP